MNFARPLPVVGLCLSCALTSHPTKRVSVAAYDSPKSWAEAVSRLVKLEWEPVVSARWSVPKSGLINLSREEAKGLKDEPVPIVLPVHVLRHPSRGTFIVDTGISESLKRGESGGVSFPFSAWLSGINGEESLKSVLARQNAPLSGVFFTHLHPDHVLGVLDVPKGTPLYSGVGETTVASLTNVFLRGSYDRLFDGQEPITELDLTQAPALGRVKHVFDFFGDGSLWVLASPGHSVGSLAFLANTTSGPVLFVGDTSHTRWGWEHQVEPGTYTADHEANRESLRDLASISGELPSVRVMVGHEVGEAAKQ